MVEDVGVVWWKDIEIGGESWGLEEEEEEAASGLERLMERWRPTPPNPQHHLTPRHPHHPAAHTSLSISRLGGNVDMPIHRHAPRVSGE